MSQDAEGHAAALAPLEGELLALEEQERQAESWGMALTAVSRALTEGRRRLWEEAARKLGALLAAPAAFQGEHFLQVSWPCTCTLSASSCRASAGRTMGMSPSVARMAWHPRRLG